MNAARPAEILRRLERADGATDTDAELLARFVATKDAAAFAELVRRHGPRLRRVPARDRAPARRGGNVQATFPLAKKADAAGRNRELVVRVAFRVAWCGPPSARTRGGFRCPLPDRPRWAAAARGTLPILDEELAPRVLPRRDRSLRPRGARGKPHVRWYLRHAVESACERAEEAARALSPRHRARLRQLARGGGSGFEAIPMISSPRRRAGGLGGRARTQPTRQTRGWRGYRANASRCGDGQESRVRYCHAPATRRG